MRLTLRIVIGRCKMDTRHFDGYDFCVKGIPQWGTPFFFVDPTDPTNQGGEIPCKERLVCCSVPRSRTVA